MNRFTLQVLVYDRIGDTPMDAAERLAKRLESVGLSGKVEGGWFPDEADGGILETNVGFGKKEA